MQTYSLLLVSMQKPDRPEDILCSNHMVAWGLWDEFGRRSHVELHYHDADTPLPAELPEVDFALIHAYFGQLIYSEIPRLRAKVRRQVLHVCELPAPRPLVDHAFVFLPSAAPHTTYIRLPLIRKLLHPASTKAPGSILLDHVWKPFRGTDNDWSQRICDWLAELGCDLDHVAQLRRVGHDEDYEFPSWIQPIPEQGYLDYLKATSSYETFVLTHPGSYEHSVIDMAARGTRVLTPVLDGKPFMPQPVLNALQLPTFSNRDELLRSLRTRTRPAAGVFTDMTEIVSIIDCYCREEEHPSCQSIP